MGCEPRNDSHELFEQSLIYQDTKTDSSCLGHCKAYPIGKVPQTHSMRHTPWIHNYRQARARCASRGGRQRCIETGHIQGKFLMIWVEKLPELRTNFRMIRSIAGSLGLGLPASITSTRVVLASLRMKEGWFQSCRGLRRRSKRV